MAVVSCSERKVLAELESISSNICNDPQRAISALDSLHSSGIRGREANAKYALLYSMALDKNCIDETDDSLINVAVSWYKRHGSADDRLKAYYYQGRIYQNAGDNESAMESFVRAEEYTAEAKDLVGIGMLYKSISIVYANIFDPGTAEKYNDMAKTCYKKAGDIDKYAGALLYSSDNFYSSGDYERAATCLDTVKALWTSISTARKINYYSSLMQLKAKQQDFAGLAGDIELYLTEFDYKDIFWYDIVNNSNQQLNCCDL